MSDSNLITLRDISFSYTGQEELLSGINLELKKSEKIGITGPNGSGKTTLFYIIMGLLRPLTGEVAIFSRQMTKEADFKEVRQRIGFLFQDSDDQLFCPTVKDEVAFGPLNHGMEREETRRIVKDTLALVGLDGFEDRPPYNLSYGEKRKLALATILATSPEVLLLDEPTNGLDEKTVAMIIDILNREDISYIVISQNSEFLKNTVKTIYTLNNGTLINRSV